MIYAAIHGVKARESSVIVAILWATSAHTIGVSHYSTISICLYNFTGKLDQDLALDSEYAQNLKKFKCKSINDNTILIEMDPGSRKTFDLGYYNQVVKRRGLFTSDSQLLVNSVTKSLVNQLLQRSLWKFYAQIAMPMEKMERINVKPGTQGETRKQCALVNS
nr:LOW QUALITY PROTEIN: peroxidase 3 [Arachis hypogaea]